MKIKKMSDVQLASMIKESVYTQNTNLGHGENDSQFLLVLAVPYGKDENVQTLQEALEAFARLLQDDDWKERQIGVYDHRTRTFFNTSYEEWIS